jgi:hypothetical protein
MLTMVAMLLATPSVTGFHAAFLARVQKMMILLLLATPSVAGFHAAFLASIQKLMILLLLLLLLIRRSLIVVAGS